MNIREKNSKILFIIIGVGGIGGNVARDLPKFAFPQDRIILIDGDTVEEKNCIRQPYQKQDIGLNKARVLARKINSFYQTETEAIDTYITDVEIDLLCKKNSEYYPIIIGCVDNDSTRKIIEKNFKMQGKATLIDGANSEYDGNVYVAIKNKTKITGAIRSKYYTLEDDINPGTIGCEEKIAKGSLQLLITNNKIAATILEYLYHISVEKAESGVSIVERFKTIHY